MLPSVIIIQQAILLMLHTVISFELAQLALAISDKSMTRFKLNQVS